MDRDARQMRAHGTLHGDHVARGGDQAAGEVVPELVQLAGTAAAVRVALRGVPTDALGENRDELIGQVERPLGLVLGWPDDDSDPACSLDKVSARFDVGRLGSLKLTGDPQSASEEVDVTDLHAEGFTSSQPGEGAECHVRGETGPRLGRSVGHA